MKKPAPQYRAAAGPAVRQFTLHGHHCLNCGHKLRLKYCENCGQAAATHRLSVKHFIVHDLVHSIWHVEHGILYTLKEVTFRPGKAALAYILGKRAGRFPIITLLLILMGLLLWLKAHGGLPARGLAGAQEQAGGAIYFQAKEFAEHNRKWLLLVIVPVSALASLICYRTIGYNYTEHLIINSYIFAGSLVICLAINAVNYTLGHPFQFFGGVTGPCILLFYGYGHWQAYGPGYRMGGFLSRFLSSGLLFALFCIFLVVATGALFSVFLSAQR